MCWIGGWQKSNLSFVDFEKEVNNSTKEIILWLRLSGGRDRF
jgi:hypothetical protein